MPLIIEPSDKILLAVSMPDELAISCGGFLCKYNRQIDVLFLNGDNDQNTIESLSSKGSQQMLYEEICNIILKANINKFFAENFSELTKNTVLNEQYDASAIDMNLYNTILVPYTGKGTSDEFLQNLLEKQGFNIDLKILRYELWNPIKNADYYEDISNFVDNKKELILSY